MLTTASHDMSVQRFLRVGFPLAICQTLRSFHWPPRTGFTPSP